MPKFDYRVSDSSGGIRTGSVEASSLNDAMRKLRREGAYVLGIQPAAAHPVADDRPLIPRRVTRQEIIYFTNELGVMVEMGVTLSAALASIKEQSENPTLGRIVTELKAAVESGEDFSAALARYPKLFDKTYVQLVRASEASGSLGQMLERIVEQGRRELESRGKVRAALAYPAVMLVASIGASVFLLVYVFPKFTPLFSRRGITLPLPTRIMMAISNFLTSYWYVAVLGAIALVAGFVWFSRSPVGRRFNDGFKLRLPILGPMFRRTALSRSLRTLATMLSSGVPMLQAIRLCGEVSGNVLYEADWNTVAEGVAAGRQIHELIADSPRFPRTLTQMISAGEQSGRLGPILTRLSDYYDRELETAIKAATSVIEPIMVCFMGVVVGTVAMALLLPIFTLSRHVG